MIDIKKAMELFSQKYKERYGEEKIEPGDTIIVVMKNCTMMVSMNENNKLNLEFFGGKPLFIDESLDAYEESENEP